MIPAQVLAACSLLSVPRSPTMQLCTLLAIFCFYRCIYHFEAWHASYFRDPPGENETPRQRHVRLAVQRMLYQPRGRALWSVFVLVFMSGLPKLLRSWIFNG